MSAAFWGMETNCTNIWNGITVKPGFHMIVTVGDLL